jgi:hypothetical protein
MPATVIPVRGIFLGFVGNISNEGYSLRSSRVVNPTDTNNVAFGETFVLNANNTYSSVKQFIASAGTVTASTPLGIAVSNVNINPTYAIPGSFNVTTPGGVYLPGQIMDGLVQGTINVSCNNGTPTAGGNVYIRTVFNAGVPAGVVGGLEAVADGTNSLVFPNLKWKTGYLETDTTAQVTILVRQIP